MTVADLNNDLTQAFKRFIQISNHKKTGRLYNSIKFTCTNVDHVLQIKFKAMEYVQYLEDGDFIDEFFDLNSTLTIIANFIASDMESI
jgi:hypothetical protein